MCSGLFQDLLHSSYDEISLDRVEHAERYSESEGEEHGMPLVNDDIVGLAAPSAGPLANRGGINDLQPDEVLASPSKRTPADHSTLG